MSGAVSLKRPITLTFSILIEPLAGRSMAVRLRSIYSHKSEKKVAELSSFLYRDDIQNYG
jgi:hypothetical protein